MSGTRGPQGLRWLLLGSLAGHLALLVAAATGWGMHRKLPRQSAAVLTTKLVRLGEERAPNLLPRLEPAPAPAARPVVALAQQEPAPKVPEPVPATPEAKSAAQQLASVKERMNALSRMGEALRAVKQRAAARQGHPEGVPEGEVTDLSRAIVGNKFATEVYRCLKANYAIEGLDPRQVANRKATVVVRVHANGSFADYQLEEGSGLAVFDAAVERAVKRCGKVSPPDAQIRDTVRVHGIEIVFQP